MGEQKWNLDILTTMNTSAASLLSHIDHLFSESANLRARARIALYCEVANQGQLYSAAAMCVDLVATRVSDYGYASTEAVRLLDEIISARTPGLMVVVDGVSVGVYEYCRVRILDILPTLLLEADNKDDGYLRALSFLIPQLADDASVVLEFLRICTLRYEGYRRQLCAEALREAEEVARNGHMP